MQQESKATRGESTVTSPTKAAAPSNPPSSSEVKVVNRIKVMMPSVVKLATPVEIPIQVQSPDLLDELYIRQMNEAEQLKINRVSGSTVYVTITPLAYAPGQTRFTFTALFSDGGISLQEVGSDVRLPDMPPRNFRGDANFSSIRLSLEDLSNVYVLHPIAQFTNLSDVDIDVGQWSTYKVTSGSSVVQVLPNGNIKALQIGEATVEVQFGSAKDYISVEVKPAGY